MDEKRLVVSEKLKELNIILPNAPDPVGAYVAYKKVSNLLYISGQLPISLDGKIIKGTPSNTKHNTTEPPLIDSHGVYCVL